MQCANRFQTLRDDDDGETPKLPAEIDDDNDDHLMPTLLAEEAPAGVNAVDKDKEEMVFGADPPILDSGAGRHIVNPKDLKGYKLDKSDHPGFRGAGGENIKVDGKATVR